MQGSWTSKGPFHPKLFYDSVISPYSKLQNLQCPLSPLPRKPHRAGGAGDSGCLAWDRVAAGSLGSCRLHFTRLSTRVALVLSKSCKDGKENIIKPSALRHCSWETCMDCSEMPVHYKCPNYLSEEATVSFTDNFNDLLWTLPICLAVTFVLSIVSI